MYLLIDFPINQLMSQITAIHCRLVNQPDVTGINSTGFNVHFFLCITTLDYIEGVLHLCSWEMQDRSFLMCLAFVISLRISENKLGSISFASITEDWYLFLLSVW